MPGDCHWPLLTEEGNRGYRYPLPAPNVLGRDLQKLYNRPDFPSQRILAYPPA